MRATISVLVFSLVASVSHSQPDENIESMLLSAFPLNDETVRAFRAKAMLSACGKYPALAAQLNDVPWELNTYRAAAIGRAERNGLEGEEAEQFVSFTTRMFYVMGSFFEAGMAEAYSTVAKADPEMTPILCEAGLSIANEVLEAR